MITRFKILLLILLSVLLQSCATFKPEPSSFENQIDSLLVWDLPNSTQAAISVYDLTDNKSIYQRNEKLLLRPASNQKILTTSAAYLFLGTDYNFKTEIFHTGNIADSVCTGDVYFKGGFDPDFSSHDLDSLVLEIKKFGIKEIRGNVYADVSAMDSLFWGEGWMWDDDPYSFAAYLTPLCINKNSVMVIATPSQLNNSVNVETIPRTGFFKIKNSAVTVDTGKTKLKVTRDWLNRRNTIIVGGVMSKSSEPDTTLLNVFNPTFYFLQLTKENCGRNGVKIDGKLDTLTLRNDAEKIFSFNRNIDAVIHDTNKNSDNLSAEMLLRALAFKYCGKPASARNGIKLLDSLITLSGKDSKTYTLVDGSGLSFYNLVSAELITAILKFLYFQNPEIYTRIYNSFPISGVDGTLKTRMRNSAAYQRVHAKTGTISGAAGLSGYIQSKKNHVIAFSILVQNYSGASDKARAFQDKICEIIYNTN